MIIIKMTNMILINIYFIFALVLFIFRSRSLVLSVSFLISYTFKKLSIISITLHFVFIKLYFLIIFETFYLILDVKS